MGIHAEEAAAQNNRPRSHVATKHGGLRLRRRALVAILFLVCVALMGWLTFPQPIADEVTHARQKRAEPLTLAEIRALKTWLAVDFAFVAVYTAFLIALAWPWLRNAWRWARRSWPK